VRPAGSTPLHLVSTIASRAATNEVVACQTVAAIVAAAAADAYIGVTSTPLSPCRIKRRSAVSRHITRYSILRLPVRLKGRKEEGNGQEKDNFLWVHEKFLGFTVMKHHYRNTVESRGR